MKKFTSSMIALAAALAANSAVVDFTYNRNGNPIKAFGYNKIDVVNVAIRINDPAMVGAKVTSMSVPLTVNFDANTIGDCSAFLSTNLRKEGKLPVANICMEPATISDDGILSCTFSEPYTITEDGVYVGYSIPVEATSQTSPCYPVAVADGTDANGLYVFASRSVTNWTSKSVSLGAVSAMTVSIEGEFSSNSGSIALESKYSGLASEETVLPITITNFGTEPISTFEYSYTVGEQTGSGTTTLSTPLEATFGAFCSSSVTVKSPATYGTHAGSVTLTKINGEEVKGNKCEFEFVSGPFVAHNRPLVEEFTGLWCGYCPRGYAALETLKEENPEDFIAIAYHDGDPMAVTSSFPVNINGLPSACVNRASIIDPSDLYSAWPSASSKAIDSNVEVELSWANEEKTIIRATVSVKFLEDQKGSDFKIGAALVGDGLHGADWGQKNYFSTYSPTGDKLLDELFVGKASVIYDLPFNDVLLSFPNMRGVAKLPAEIKKYEAVTYTEDFNLDQVIGIATFANVIQDIEKLRVVGILFDKNGKPLNSGTSDYCTAGGTLTEPTVAAPIVTAMTPATDDQPAEITFECPTTYGGVEGFLQPNAAAKGVASRAAGKNYFYVSLFVDGKPYVFTPENYPGLIQDTKAIVFGDNGIENTSFANGMMKVKVFGANIESIGVQTKYVYSGLTLESDVTTVDANEEFSSIEVVNLGNVKASEAYFDLQGRQISAPRHGRIAVRRTVSTDGSVKAEKIRF